MNVVTHTSSEGRNGNKKCIWYGWYKSLWGSCFGLNLEAWLGKIVIILYAHSVCVTRNRDHRLQLCDVYESKR